MSKLEQNVGFNKSAILNLKNGAAQLLFLSASVDVKIIWGGPPDPGILWVMGTQFWGWRGGDGGGWELTSKYADLHIVLWPKRGGGVDDVCCSLAYKDDKPKPVTPFPFHLSAARRPYSLGPGNHTPNPLPPQPFPSVSISPSLVFSPRTAVLRLDSAENKTGSRN